MRIGFNPNKDKVLPKSDYIHQVIVPVHLPNEEGYFKDGLQILKLCLESLIITTHSKTFITIVCNDCSVKVKEYINSLYIQNNVHEVIFTNGIGKINAVLKGLAGQNCDLVTISDADVLFLNGWQIATYEIFDAFPKAGAVCTTPSSKVLKQSTANILFDYFFSDKMMMEPVSNPDAMQKFAESIGNENFYNRVQLQYNLIITRNNCKAVVGAGHFVATYKRVIFKKPKAIYSNSKMGKALKEYFDKPVLNHGYYRLSTIDNFTYHLGNVKEEWMDEIFKSLKKINFVFSKSDFEKKVDKKSRKIISDLFFRIITQKTIWKLFLQYKGLTKEESKMY